MCAFMELMAITSRKVIRPDIMGPKRRTVWWSTAPDITMRPGAVIIGTVTRSRGAAAGGLAGPRGTTGVSRSDLAGAAAMAITGGDGVIRRRHGGDPFHIPGMAVTAAWWHGGKLRV